MSLKHWTGTAYQDVELGHADKALTWDGTDYVQVWPVGSPIEYIGDQYATTTTVTIPTHQAGDLIIAHSVSGSASAGPTIPTGWTQTHRGTYSALAYRIASAPGTTSGTWTGAAYVAVFVFRGASAIGNYAISTLQTGTTITFPAITITNPGQSWAMRGFEGNQSRSVTSGPSSQPSQQLWTGTSPGFAWISDGPVTDNIPTATTTISGTTAAVSMTWEVLPA